MKIKYLIIPEILALLAFSVGISLASDSRIKFDENPVPENDLEAKAIELLDELDFNGYTFNPHRVIKTVNIFYSLGQEKSCQIFHNYFELNSDNCILDFITEPVVQNLFLDKGEVNEDFLDQFIQDASITIPEIRFLQLKFPL
ncbi:MAG TPA: hypothetical protein VK184_21540 [Nostocaceae cyanobacterium]|nr:hypothetical protein [Nostocaceae cyanobacterium]